MPKLPLLQRVQETHAMLLTPDGKPTRSDLIQLMADMETALTAVDAVARAFKTLSYSEVKGIQAIALELTDGSGLVVASKIADRAGITRSVIITALRKFESAGVIQSDSLGMKGTHIKGLIEGWTERLHAA